jgi:cellulose synthase/poly-beta-1,6-N-acetylglucosamine synthase-like glycosyltransferase
MMIFQETFGLLLIVITGTYGFLICAFTIGLIKIIRHQPLQSRQHKGFVSVIIPVRNEEGNILRILEEMRGQDFPATLLEVIVADDYSEDSTMILAGNFAQEHPEFPIKLIPSTLSGTIVPGKKSAIARAVAMARGEILLFTDADTWRGTGWISSMVSAFGSEEIQMVLGPVFFCNEQTLLQKIQALEFSGIMGTTAGSAALGYPVMCNGANLAYRRTAFFQTGGFRDNIRHASGDDQFMMSAIRKQFGKRSLVFNADPLSRVSTEPEATAGGFLNQRLRWVSKSIGYRDPVVIFAGIVTWLTHLLLLTGIFLGFSFPYLFRLSLFIWFAKILVEYPMVWIMTRFFNKQKLRGYYFIAQAFQLFYVPLAVLLGLLVPYRWKGRTG